MEDLLRQYPELPWNMATAPLQLTRHWEPESKHQDLISFTHSIIPRSWCWSKAEQELRPLAYKMDIQGVPGLKERHPSMVAIILAGILVSFTSSIWILVPTIFMSFEGGRTRGLVTVAVVVTLFGFFFVVGVRTKSSETFLATATYAAVLIIFVSSCSSISNQ
jgi:Family of unknown function (DUF6594)